MTIQQEVYQSVIKRGYREGYTAEQFAARQVAKLQEEIWELAQRIDLPIQVYRTMELAGRTAKDWFDKGKTEDDISGAVWVLKQELADIQVVVFCLMEALNELDTKGDSDITKLALDKAQKDVQRGVR